MPEGVVDKPRFGAFEIVRPLARGPISERWLACHEFEHSSHVVHYFGARHDRGGQRRFLDAVREVAFLQDSHLVSIEQFAVTSGGRGVIVTPYTGNTRGLLSLETLLELKGGRMGPIEAERAITHVLEGLRAGGEVGGNGPITAAQVLVDRHGRASIEFYGLAPRLRGTPALGPESVRDEVRSVAELGYRLLTGLSPDEPRVPVAKLDKRLSKGWENWLERGLDAVAGFATPDEALAALPSNSGDNGDSRASVGPVRVLLNRFRWPAGRSQ